MRSRLPLIIAHRGSSATTPENTIAAFTKALDDNADGIELDVRLARDGVPVVIHDATLGRTGLIDGAVAKMTSVELGKLDVGSWFKAKDNYASEGVPSLEHVFQLVSDRAADNFIVYIELKTDAKSSDDLVRSVADLINNYRFQHHVVLVSFDLPALKQTKLLDPSIRTGALFAPRHGGGIGLRAERIVALALDCGADEILLHRFIARPKLISAAARANLPVVVWTVDDVAWLNRARDLGVHALITNDPALLLTEVARTSRL
ncbi:MAG TPA: glycerophosphodiester phosphodiesterase family protein [Pyrinomonadaceae bacterium]|nr:glycerophosphodiester phosphodiesterase family protein [Pyrinomonadaceae bacterium]